MNAISRTKTHVPSKPTFAAVVQETLATKAANDVEINIAHGTHLDKPAVFFDAKDYFVNLVNDYKFTIIGIFIKGKPNMEELRKLFVSQYHLKETPTMAYYDYRTVYIDFTNEIDFNHIYFKPYIHIGQYAIKVQKWTNVAKVKVEIDLLKPKQDIIWLGFKRLDGTEDGRWLEVEYEGAPTYCHYFKIQGHEEQQCRTKDVDTDTKKKSKKIAEKSRLRDSNKQDKDGFQEVKSKKFNRKNGGIVSNEPVPSKHQKSKVTNVPGKEKQKVDNTNREQSKEKQKMIKQVVNKQAAIKNIETKHSASTPTTKQQKIKNIETKQINNKFNEQQNTQQARKNTRKNRNQKNVSWEDQTEKEPMATPVQQKQTTNKHHQNID
ncbi:uncharacterized protein LOC132601380 [Lycium barbarum]|uniref:uncharacterized protein LOC132601380 n=1 Tax=Lycium barbarum TaxID=112863 RepID=UPI00293F4F5C|nr:uncharacterized protein LOC132601380 [Lycium barbarum]